MRERGKRDAITVVIIVVVVLIVVLVWTSSWNSASKSERYDYSYIHGDHVGLVNIYGPIYDSRRWCEQIDDFRQEDQVKAIVVRIDSPGGGVASSQELYTAIKRASESKPVIASLGGVATSGGYYAAVGADTIVANPGTTTGSIGVIMELTQFYELMDKIGVDAEIIKSGEYKDTGWPFRDITPKERKYLQAYIDDAFDQFINTIALEREMDLSEVKKIADGRVFTGRQAHELKLVDVLGDQYQAIRIAGEISGLGPEPEILKPPKKYPYDWLEELLDEGVKTVINHIDDNPMFEYRWRIAK